MVMRFLLLLVMFGCALGRVPLHGQPAQDGRVTVGLRAGLAQPTGLFALRSTPVNSEGELIAGGARTGFSVAMQARAWLTPTIGLMASLDRAQFPGTAGTIGWHPMNCRQCALSGEGPVMQNRSGTASRDWVTNSWLLGPVFRLNTERPEILLWAAVGQRYVEVPALVYTETGTWRAYVPPTFIADVIPYSARMDWTWSETVAMAYGFGLDVRKGLGQRFQLLFSAEVHGSTIRSSGTYEIYYDYEGVIEDGYRTGNYDQLRRMNYVQLRAGVEYDFFRKARSNRGNGE